MDFEELTPEESVDLNEIMKLIDMPAEDDIPAIEEDTAPAHGEQPETPEAPKKKTKKKISPQKSIVLYLHDLA